MTSNILLLNASYEPLAVVPLRRAVILLLRERAEIVAARDGRAVTSGGGSRLPYPSVIRLVRYVRVPYRTTMAVSRKRVLARDHQRCAYCHRRATTIDHVVPRARGGPDSWENLVAACESCNTAKGSRTLDELGWKLAFTPSAPTRVEWLLVGFARIDESWQPYLAGAWAPAAVAG